MNKKAVVLLSGGMDSAVCSAIAKAEGYDLYCLTILYGQTHSFEIEKAKQLVTKLGALRHLILHVPLSEFGGSALTGSEEIPKLRDLSEISNNIPPTYVPARNTVFLALALSWAEAISARDIFIGVNALDYSGYPDCRPDFIHAFENLANLATKTGVEGGVFRIHTPLIKMSKSEIVKKGLELGVDFALTSSCYDPTPDGIPCLRCDACLLRQKGFQDAGVPDPILEK